MYCHCSYGSKCHKHVKFLTSHKLYLRFLSPSLSFSAVAITALQSLEQSDLSLECKTRSRVANTGLLTGSVTKLSRFVLFNMVLVTFFNTGKKLSGMATATVVGMAEAANVFGSTI